MPTTRTTARIVIKGLAAFVVAMVVVPVSTVVVVTELDRDAEVVSPKSVPFGKVSG
jgi:hypothetical protein